MIFLTTGDSDGIGLEVAIKALGQIKKPFVKPLFLFRSHHTPPLRWMPKHKGGPFVFSAPTISVSDCEAELPRLLQLLRPRPGQIFDLACHDSPARWVFAAAKLCHRHPEYSLVTGPISKEIIHSAGLQVMGHTGILKKVTKSQNLRMLFLGDQCNVLLATDHIPLNAVESSLRKKDLRQALGLLPRALALLPAKTRRLPIIVLGLNPHAGENGLIGNFEKEVLRPRLRTLRHAYNIVSADSAFLPEFRKRHSLYLALYHDQGLIPFKTLHGFEGVHVTLGLGFLRTSVDHGTAKELFNKGVADPKSMLEALRLALKASPQGF